MAKLTLTDLANLQNETTAVNAINANNAAIETAMENTLSRDGTSPNTMGATLDMNSNRIVNLPNPIGLTEPIRLTDLSTFLGGGTINALPAGGTTNQVLKKNSNTNYDVSWGSSSGTVTSVGLSLPADFSVSGSPVTTSGTLTATLANTPTGTGGFVRQTSPTLVTPTLGVATATSINKVAITQPAFGSVLTITDNHIFTVNNTLTLAGTDSTTITFQGTDTYVGRATTDTLTNKTFNTAGTGNVFQINGTGITAVTGTGSVVLAANPQFTNNIGIGTAPINDMGINCASIIDGNNSDAAGIQVVPTWRISNSTTKTNVWGQFIASAMEGGTARVITEGGGLRILDTFMNAGATLTNQYGIRVDKMVSGTNNYAIISDGDTSTGVSAFWGNGTRTPQAAYHINRNAAQTITAPTDTYLHITGQDSHNAVINVSSFGTSTTSTLNFRSARNSGASPSQTQTGDVLGSVNFNGYHNSNNYSTTAGQITCTALENFTSSSQGTQLNFYVTSIGTTSQTPVITASAASFTIVGGLSAKAPVTLSGTTGSWTGTENSLIINPSAAFTLTITFPTAGRMLWVKCVAGFAVSSSASNVVPLGGGAAGTAILSGSGKWALLQFDGTNWITLAAN